MMMRAMVVALLLLTSLSTIKAADRIELESSVVIGNRELPKSLYIVPWKSSKKEGLVDWGLLKGHEEPLIPIDRYVFQRELQYNAQYEKNNRTANR